MGPGYFQASQNRRAPEMSELETSQIEKKKLDLVLLRYMVRRLQFALSKAAPEGSSRQGRPRVHNPQRVYKLQERRSWTHRVEVFQKEELLGKIPLAFVGFITAKRRPLSPTVLKAILGSERVLVKSLSNLPGVLCYSSIEHCHAVQCSLLLLSDASACAQVVGSIADRYSAVPSYYSWVRLYRGVMQEGLDHLEMQLQETGYYIFRSE
jgi:hypothetical protein